MSLETASQKASSSTHNIGIIRETLDYNSSINKKSKNKSRVVLLNHKGAENLREKTQKREKKPKERTLLRENTK